MGTTPMTRILQKHLLNCIGKGQPHAPNQKQSQVKPRQKRRIIAPAKLMKYNQYGKHMTLVNPVIDGVFCSELFYINICIR